MTPDDATPASFLYTRAYRKEPAVTSSGVIALALSALKDVHFRLGQAK
jgi:hypothetical protein